MRTVLRLLAPVLLIYLLMLVWSLPWAFHALSAAALAALVSAGRALRERSHPVPRRKEMTADTAREAARTATWGGLAVIAVGLGLYWVCHGLLTTAAPSDIERTWGSVLAFHMHHNWGTVLFSYVAVVLLYVGFAALARTIDLATDRSD